MERIVCFLFLIFNLSFATGIYVATTGDNAGAGTSGDPYASLEYALPLAVGGDSVYVQSGTYTMDSTANVAATGLFYEPITVVGTNGSWSIDGSKPVLDATAASPGININFASAAITIKYIDVRKAATNGIEIGTGINYGQVIIQFCCIDSCTGSGIWTNESSSGLSIKVDLDSIYDNGDWGIEANSVSRFAPYSIENSFISGNTSGGIYHGYIAFARIAIINNIFVGNTGSDIYHAAKSLDGAFKVSNNIFKDGSGNGILLTDTVVNINIFNNCFVGKAIYGVKFLAYDLRTFTYFDNNAYYNNDSGATNLPSTPGSTNITTDPLIQANLKPANNSPLRDTTKCKFNIVYY